MLSSNIGQIFPIPLCLYILLGDEAEGGDVDTVAEAAGFLWPIRENITKMIVAYAASDLFLYHSP